MKCTLKKKQLFFVRKIVLSFLILSCFSLSFRANVPVKNWLHGNVCEGQLFVTQENVRFYTTKLAKKSELVKDLNKEVEQIIPCVDRFSNRY